MAVKKAAVAKSGRGKSLGFDFKTVLSTIEKAVAKDRGKKTHGSIEMCSGVALAANKFFTLGLPLFELAVNGGIPFARITHVWGESSVGKTMVGLHAAAKFQALYPEGVVFYIDSERALSGEFPRIMGVDMSRVIFVVPDTAELCMLAIEHGIIQLYAYGYKHILVVWDSVAATITDSEDEGGYDSKRPSELARTLSRGIKKLRPVVVRYNVPLVVLNQCRSKIGVTFGAKTGPCGGKALIFYSDLSLQLRRIENFRVSKDADPHGMLVQVSVDKSRVGLPHRRARFHMYYGSGLLIDLPETYDALKRYGLAGKGGAGIKIFAGFDEAANASWLEYRSNADFQRALLDDPILYQNLLVQLKAATLRSDGVEIIGAP